MYLSKIFSVFVEDIMEHPFSFTDFHQTTLPPYSVLSVTQEETGVVMYLQLSYFL